MDRRRFQKRSRRGRRRAVAIVVGVLALAGVGAWIAGGGSDDPPGSWHEVDVTVLGMH